MGKSEGMFYVYVNCDCIGEYDSLVSAVAEAENELRFDPDAVIDVLDCDDNSVWGVN